MADIMPGSCSPALALAGLDLDISPAPPVKVDRERSPADKTDGFGAEERCSHFQPAFAASNRTYYNGIHHPETIHHLSSIHCSDPMMACCNCSSHSSSRSIDRPPRAMKGLYSTPRSTTAINARLPARSKSSSQDQTTSKRLENAGPDREGTFKIAKGNEERYTSLLALCGMNNRSSPPPSAMGEGQKFPLLPGKKTRYRSQISEDPSQYDPDAAEISNVITPASDVGTVRIERGRAAIIHRVSTSPNPRRETKPRSTRMSTSASPVRTSLDRLETRRSHSLSPVPQFYMSDALRLPSFSTTSSSNKWKANVLETLQLSSLSHSALERDAHRLGHSHVLPTATSISKKPSVEPFPPFEIACPTPKRPHVSSLTRWPVHSELSSGSNCGATHKKSPPGSVHLDGLNIHLRLMPTDSEPATEIPTPHALSISSTHKQRDGSGSHFRSEDVPPEWGRVVSRSEQRDNSPSSSIYSSRPSSSGRSNTDIPTENRQFFSLDAAVNSDDAINSMPGPSFSLPLPTISESKKFVVNLPTNPSTSSLGKESRFKEELDVSKSYTGRRSSVLSFIGLGPKKSNEPVRGSEDMLEGNSNHNESPKIELASVNRSKTVIRFRKHSPRNKTVAQEPKQAQDQATILAHGKAPAGQLAEQIQQDKNKPTVAEDVAKLAAERTATLSTRRDAIGLMAKAIETTTAERSAFLLPQHKEEARRPGVRQRSASCYRPNRTPSPNEGSDSPVPILPAAICSENDSRLTPDFCTPSFRSPGNQGRLMSVAVDPMDKNQLAPQKLSATHLAPSPRSSHSNSPEPHVGTYRNDELTRRSIIKNFDTTNEPLGAWSRYPSHNRTQRTGSAGAADKVITKDFAFIDPSLITSETEDQRSPGRLKRSLSEKRILGLGKALNIFKHYGQFFRDSSLEYLSQGHGHRTSISAGGKLAEPELEIIRPIWAPLPVTQEEVASVTPNPPKSSERFGSLVSRDPLEEKQRVPNTSRESISNEQGKARTLAVSSMDGNLEKEDLQQLRTKSVSAPDLRHESLDATSSSLPWAHQYGSCVTFPPPGDSGAENNFPRYKDSMFSDIDYSENAKRMSSGLSSPVESTSFAWTQRTSPARERGRRASLPAGKGHTKTLLLETEERERLKGMGVVPTDAFDRLEAASKHSVPAV